MGFLADQLNITKDQALAQIAQSNFLKVPATVQDTANAAVLIASDRGRMLTGTVVNATAGAALDKKTNAKKDVCRHKPHTSRDRS
jgi:enoyl-[acyl-carrier-protein] reductase (NADH)